MFVNPKETLERIGISAGSYVADFGAGSGHWSLALSKMVGEEGVVYAIDIQRELLTRLQAEARGQNLNNIRIVTGDLDELGGSKLRDNQVDTVIAANLLFQVEEKGKFLDEIKRVLKSKGRLLLIDWEESFGSMGPRQEDVIPKEKARMLAEKAGLEFVDDVKSGAHHYGMLFRKQ
jgi:ubiquinone/menaquinone biosynthesis C-methylase UbiE